jgi:hypothetical protein
MHRPLLLTALLFALTSSACGTPDPGDGWGSHADVGAILQNDCSSCHSSTWSSCWTAHDDASVLVGVIQSGAMPRNGPMAPADKETVLSWLQGGAPCVGAEPDGGGGGGGGPVPFGSGGAL